jgi:hypothetical protein
MKKSPSIALILSLALASCGGSNKGGGVAPGAGGAPGSGGDSSSSGGGGGTIATPPSGGSSTGGESGGDTNPDGAVGGGTGGSAGPEVDAAAPPASDGGTVVSTDGGGGPTPMGMGHPGSLGFYEAEQGVITGRAVKGHCTACPSTATMKAGDSCCSGGGEVSWLVAHGNGEVQFNGVMAPADGMYDVTWWYHCGNDDNFHDPVCRGEPHTASGCRPAQLTVNGVVMKPIFEFPCFPGSFDIVHAATTAVPLKAGAMNTIKLTASFTNNDAADIDAISVYAPGKGWKPHLPKSVSKDP